MTRWYPPGTPSLSRFGEWPLAGTSMREFSLDHEIGDKKASVNSITRPKRPLIAYTGPLWLQAIGIKGGREASAVVGSAASPLYSGLLVVSLDNVELLSRYGLVSPAPLLRCNSIRPADDARRTSLGPC